MSKTLFQKIWDRHVVKTNPDGSVLLYIDRQLVHEVTSPQAFEGLRLSNRKVRRPGRKPPAWQLTFKQAGKTRTVYVPAELVPEVQLWAKEFKRLKRLIRKITTQNLAVIRRHTAVRRAESRARPPRAKRSGGTYSSSSATASRS